MWLRSKYIGGINDTYSFKRLITSNKTTPTLASIPPDAGFILIRKNVEFFMPAIAGNFFMSSALTSDRAI